MSDNKPIDADAIWRDWFTVNAAKVDSMSWGRFRRILRVLPREPRCKLCNLPFEGLGGGVLRAVLGTKPSTLNPRFCNMCHNVPRRQPFFRIRTSNYRWPVKPGRGRANRSFPHPAGQMAALFRRLHSNGNQRSKHD